MRLQAGRRTRRLGGIRGHPAARAGPRDQLPEGSADAGQPFPLGQRTGILASDHHRIDTWRESGALDRESLAEKAFNLISVYRTSNLPGHREPEPRRCRLAAREHVQHELTTGVSAATAKDPVEVGAAR